MSFVRQAAAASSTSSLSRASGPRDAAARAALVDVALGRRPADLVVKNAQVYNPFIRAFERGDLAVAAGRSAGLGSFRGLAEVDARGGWLLPGFFDAHVHLESSMTGPAEFARTVCAAGTTTVVADPHEIANVAGLAGLEWLLAATENLPINVLIMLPSCVPATPLERGGAALSAADLAPWLGRPRVLGLGEMMNFPGVLAAAPEVTAKLALAELVDGHSPGLSGAALAAYVGAGVSTDHECVSPAEAAERLALGMRVMLREGTAAKNLLALLPATTPANSPFCLFATDDRHARDLLEEGGVNHMVALAVAAGFDLPSVLNMAAFNGPLHYGLRDLGALTPGFRADMALYPDLTTFKPALVWKDGRLAARDGQALLDEASGETVDDAAVRGTVRLGELSSESLRVPAVGPRLRAVGVTPGQVVTRHVILSPQPRAGLYEADPAADLAKLAVWNRYEAGGRPAVGFIQGLGLRRGALASTVGHDSHNLICAGADDADMLECARLLERMDGGLALVLGGRELASLPLPLGGLMSDRPMAETAAALERLTVAGRALGFDGRLDPFMTLAFMSLPVIPSLKLTAAGLVDVEAFRLVETVLPA
ncbi:MAG: adenine deaminase [Deltaproteobacteria bacterium]|jgi:adenine deaminase|nr:adenine deaminase [Deltaproteobacteria bacterium]